MTKFKEYLRSAKGMLLDCDFEALPCAGIEHIEARVVGSGIEVVTHYMYYSDTDKVVFSRDGLCNRLGENWSVTNERFDKRYAEAPNGFSDYVDWLRGMGYGSGRARAVMQFVYESDEKVRVAFNHMKAGIMDKEVFRKWHVKHCLEYVGVL